MMGGRAGGLQARMRGGGQFRREWPSCWAGFPFLEDLGKILSREVDCYVEREDVFFSSRDFYSTLVDGRSPAVA